MFVIKIFLPFPVITNKNVEYFGFPKSEEFAQKWAIAAGRDDLLDKTLNNIIKYYLCSSHFTDDCFTDETRMHLKKQSRPKVVVPIPSIFKNNITEFFPDAVKFSSYVDLNDPSPLKEEASETIEEEMFLDERLEDQNATENKQVHVYVVPESNSTVVNEESLILDEREELLILNQCRLCANTFVEVDDALIPIFNADETIVESIERILPETVFPDDGKPQQICWTCYHKLNQCIDIIGFFHVAQAKFD